MRISEKLHHPRKREVDQERLEIKFSSGAFRPESSILGGPNGTMVSVLWKLLLHMRYEKIVMRRDDLF